MTRTRPPLLLIACCALQGCAPAVQTTSLGTAGQASPPPVAASALSTPQIAGPRYKPSSKGEALPIAGNAYGAFSGAPDAPEIGDVATDFELPTIDGGMFRLAEARKAGPVLVMFYRGFW